MREIAIEFDVTTATGLPSRAVVSASLFAPDQLSGPSARLLVCIPGASYTRSYYHPQIPGRSDYSFSQYFTARNFLVLALDTLGMGASTQPEPESLLSRVLIARAHHEVSMQAVAGLRSGRWLPDTRFEAIDITGVGHSMGGMLAVTQQGRFKSFDRLAVLGWTNLSLVVSDAEQRELKNALRQVGYLTVPREPMREAFHMTDVPADVIAADDACATATPASIGNDTLRPGVVAEEAASIECPVFLLYGERDLSPEPRKEVGPYRSSRDITFVMLEHSGHCHNFASTRQLAWQRLWQWLAPPTGQRADHTPNKA